VIVTHYHPDHIGLAGWLTERWQAPLWVSEKEWLFARVMSRGADDFAPSRRDFARRTGLDPASVELFGERENSYRRGVPSVPASFQRLADGMTVEIGGREWRVIVGEGHAPELTCLYCAEAGVLISSDQVLPKISPNISVQAHEPDGDPLARFLSSLAKLRESVPPETLVLPSHNLPFFGLHARIDALEAHHRARCGEVLVACELPKTAVELLPVLFRRTLDRHQLGFALGEALAHLHYLMH
jgi:glyoxylase-like metal-dependent hydrolase (beta-lactamase superfamily II)